MNLKIKKAVQIASGPVVTVQVWVSRARSALFIKPFVQIPVGKEIQTEHDGHILEGPPHLREIVEPLYNQQGDKDCPNLNAKSILAHSDKGLDFEVLFQGLKVCIPYRLSAIVGTQNYGLHPVCKQYVCNVAKVFKGTD